MHVKAHAMILTKARGSAPTPPRSLVCEPPQRTLISSTCLSSSARWLPRTDNSPRVDGAESKLTLQFAGMFLLTSVCLIACAASGNMFHFSSVSSFLTHGMIIISYTGTGVFLTHATGCEQGRCPQMLPDPRLFPPINHRITSRLKA